MLHKTKQNLFLSLTASLLIIVFSSINSFAQKYRIDTEGAHASINFKIKHLGYSWLTGRFNTFKGKFNFDPKHPDQSNIELTVNTASVDSNHAERDKHLRGKKFLNVKKFPKATFISTSYKAINSTTGMLSGKLTLHGVTRPVSMKVIQLGAGKDPWGGFRRGFETKLSIRLHDYGIKHSLGSASEVLELSIFIEGIKDHKYITEE
jgi:polyisoprenoid-binding protein YceI